MNELRVFTVILGSWHGFQAGISKVVPSVTGHPVVAHMKVVACSAYTIIL